MLKRSLQCSYQTQLNVQIRIFKRDHCMVHITISDHEMSFQINSAGIYLLKVNNRNTRTRCGICSKLTIKTPERRHWRIFIVNFEHISHLVLVFLLLTLNM